jgi:hypothetical protein
MTYINTLLTQFRPLPPRTWFPSRLRVLVGPFLEPVPRVQAAPYPYPSKSRLILNQLFIRPNINKDIQEMTKFPHKFFLFECEM